MKRNKGFTLVELLAVIVVLALIMILAIPAILQIMDNARKNSFYLYAQNVYQKALNKYVSDSNNNVVGGLNCSVYKIGSEDLDISNKGDYDGWVKVERKPAASGNYEYSKEVSVAAGSKLYNVRYCLKQGAQCNPAVFEDDPTYSSNYIDTDDGNKVTIKQTRNNENYYLCVTYEYPDASGHLQRTGVDCNSEKKAITGDTYEYVVTLSMRNKDRAVEGAIMKDQDDANNTDFKTEFFNYMESYKNLYVEKGHYEEVDGKQKYIIDQPGTIEKMPLHELTCSGLPGELISNSGERISTTVTTTTTTTSQQQYTVVTTDAPTTSQVVETTFAAVDDSILLQSLSVAGYDIGFAPIQQTYHITVPYTTESLSVSATPKDASSTVEMSGADTINVGNNTIAIHVLNPNGKEAWYYIYATRLGGSQGGGGVETTTKIYDPSEGLPDPSLPSSNAKLANIIISGFQMNDPFAPETYDYDIEIPAETKELFMTAIPQQANAKVTIDGNSNLTDGSKITITVRSENGYYTSTYSITAHNKKTTNKSTVIVRTIAVGLLAVLIALLIAIRKQKQGSKVISNNEQQVETGGYVQPTQVNQNNDNQGNV